MNERPSKSERLNDLLADQALFGLTDDETNELNRLTAGSALDDETFERAAAIASLAFQKKSRVSFPTGLRQRILNSFPVAPSLPESNSPGSQVTEPAGADPLASVSRKHTQMNRREMAAWLLATASMAGLLIERLGLWSTSRRGLSPAELRAKMLKSETDIILTAWTKTGDPSARDARGDVIWSTAAQKGFIRIKGLPKNEPFVHQYQLWIFDTKQDPRYPIDGGTFDVESKDAETVVPILARLPVVHPTMFAVTIEKRGGVVVSSRERMLLVAELTSA